MWLPEIGALDPDTGSSYQRSANVTRNKLGPVNKSESSVRGSMAKSVSEKVIAFGAQNLGKGVLAVADREGLKMLDVCFLPAGQDVPMSISMTDREEDRSPVVAGRS